MKKNIKVLQSETEKRRSVGGKSMKRDQKIKTKRGKRKEKKKEKS